MTVSQNAALGYLLVEPPGVIRASTMSDGAIHAGASVDDALGVSWEELSHIARTTNELVTPRGRYGLEVMRNADRAIAGVLVLVTEEAAARPLTTVPPASATRVTIGLELVAGKDPAARAAVDLAMRLAKTMLPMYIACEDGAGADIVARAVVGASGRDPGSFFHVRAGASTGDPLADILFGPGAERARGGTLYVEDIEELDVETGRRLAREVDRGSFADAHFIASGTADLRERVARGTFSRELHTLVRSSTVTLPPLRDRDDFEHIVRAVLAHIGGGTSERSPRYEVALETLRVLKAHPWPGNLRELTAWLERAVAIAAPERVIRPEHLPLDATEADRHDGASQGLRQVAERSALEEALRAAGGNVSLAAKKLGVARSTLYRMKQRHKVDK